MSFLNFGYYIVEPVSKPEYISLNCSNILSISMCICNFHPSLNGSFWLNHEKEQIKYQNELGISDDSFSTMKDTVSNLFNQNKLDSDSRFANYTDALGFYKKYLFSLNKLKIVAIALSNEYKNTFCGEIENNSNILSTLEVPQEDGNLWGYEILGWDYGGFHSYLCNGFDKNISEEYKLEVNEFGIIQNSYAEVKDFTKCLEDKGGEPVIWLPFAIYECPTK